MIRVYSIKEIIQASENIFNTSSKKINSKENHDSINQKKMSTENPLVLKKDLEITPEAPKDIESIIVEAEKAQSKNKLNKLSQRNHKKHTPTKNIIKTEDVVNQLYNLFNKKIKKNTLKLIVDLRYEISSLDEKIITLKEREKKIKLNNKLLNEEISNLTDHVKNLKDTIKKKDLEINSINQKLIDNQNKIIHLETNNSELNSKIDIYQNQIIQLKNENNELENNNNELKNNNSELNSKIDIYQNQIIQLKNENKELNDELAKSLDNQEIIDKNNQDLNLKLDELESLKVFKHEAQILNQKNSDLQITLDNLKVVDVKNKNDLDIIKVLEEKVSFYQEENVRISNDLIESRKKYDITKNQIQGFEDQRSTLLDKINSVNEVIQNEKVVTSVFENSQTINLNDLEKKNKSKRKLTRTGSDINNEILKIFKT
jgi:chromosome segregation ATPase